MPNFKILDIKKTLAFFKYLECTYEVKTLDKGGFLILLFSNNGERYIVFENDGVYGLVTTTYASVFTGQFDVKQVKEVIDILSEKYKSLDIRISKSEMDKQRIEIESVGYIVYSKIFKQYYLLTSSTLIPLKMKKVRFAL